MRGVSRSRRPEVAPGICRSETFPAADVRVLPQLRPLVATQLPHLRLILHSKYAVEPVTGLRTGALDVAFMRGPMDERGLEVIDLLPEQIVVVLPAHHALARRQRIPVHLLNDLPCITMDRALAPALHDAIAALYGQARIRMQAVSSADNVLGHLQLVQEGLGFALLPDSVGALLPPGVVLKPLAHDPVPTVSIVIAWKTGNASPLVRTFVDLVRQSTSTTKDVARLTGRRRKS
jgi:LysR family hca operon transcriptional activator